MLWKKTERFWKTGLTENKDGGVEYVSNGIIPSGNNSKTGILLILFLLVNSSVSVCGKDIKRENISYETGTEDMDLEEHIVSEEEKTAEQLEKGYNLPVDEEAGEQAKKDCREVMGMIADIYKSADKGSASNVVISHEVMLRMKAVIKETGYPVTSSETYAVMENYEKMDTFLQSCLDGKKGTALMYQVYSNGGIGRMEYVFDGTDMYLLAVGAAWDQKNQPEITYLSYTRFKEWKYTDKGWFCYQLCMPEYPEVTEMMDGSSMVRVKPLTERQRELSKQCVLPLGYQGNNILCSNWNTETMSELDYNGMYEYLYKMKYGERMDAEDYPNGIPAEEFESLIMEYFPVSAEQIREWAVFDKEYGTYRWTRLGCMNYAPTFFSTSLPEVIDEKKNADGTITLTVEAVRDMIICDDGVITHELKIQFAEDGSFQYLGNEILNGGINDIPKYQYRFVDNSYGKK
ncbi:MAG: DUF6070 family protein [Eubacteriales bacterium]|nr:DUF6070 family protein [Eubacteriales bacterium]